MTSAAPDDKSLADRATAAGQAGLVSAVAAPVIKSGLAAALNPGQTAKNVGGYLGKALRVDPACVATFDAAGLAPTLGDVSASGVVKRAQNVLDHVPVASSIIDKGKRRVADGVEQGQANVDFDPSLEKAVGGDALKAGLGGYLKRGNELFDKQFAAFEAKHISPNEPTTVASTLIKINEIMSRADTPEALDVYLGATEKASCRSWKRPGR